MTIRRHRSHRRPTLLAAGLLCLGGSAYAEPLHRPLPPGISVDRQGEHENSRWFVELDAPSVAELRALRIARGADVPAADAQRRHAASLAAQQDAMSRTMAPLIEHEHSRLRVALNGFRISATRANAARLRALDGVRRVVPIAHLEPDNSAGVSWVQAPQVWASLGDGAGLTIAIIDTGIDYLHANFGGTGDPLEYEANDKGVLEPGTFPTAKVIGGWDFAGPTYNSRVDEVPQPDADPLDGNGHGSHVAGTAAGLGVPDRIGPGVAPGASLMALKVFSDESGSTDLTADAIDYALDPNRDGSMDDRVDVINMSLGARFGDPNDPSALASTNAAANGVVVVASAGNNGDNPYVTGAPAVSPGAISVAATIAGGRLRPALRVIGGDPQIAGLYTAAEGAGPVKIVDAPLRRPLVQARSASRRTSLESAPVDDRACGRLGNAAEIAGNIALVARGGCSYETKYANVQLAGGAGIVVYNVGVTPDDPTVMGGIGVSGKVFAIPGLMISGSDGLALVAALAGAPLIGEFNVSHTAPPVPELADRMTFFSSRGPSHGGARFKPDLAAPGRYIVSTDAGTGFRGLQLRGTSMAAPHVAGAATLLRQQHADLPVAAIKALLQNASVDSEYLGPGTDTVVPLTLQGTGVIRVADALALSSYVAPAGLSFGYVNPLDDMQREVSASVVNLGDQPRTFTVSQRPRGVVPGLNVECPDTVSVPASGSATMTLTMSVDADALPADPGRFTHQEADGWCVLSDGLDTLRVGYVGAADPAASITATTTGSQAVLSNSGAADGIAQGFRLTASGSEDVAGAQRRIAATGFRIASVFGFDVFEFALVLDETWESPAHVVTHLYIDTNRNGRYERMLYASDWSRLGFDPGTYVTGVFLIDENGEPKTDSGYVDWPAEQIDFNDRAMILPYTLNPDAGLSFLKPNDRSFDYRLVVYARDGSFDVQYGSVDLDEAPIAGSDAAPVTVPAGETVTLDYAGFAPDLWLLPSNPAPAQHAVTE